MKIFGEWILITFVLYYIFALVTKSKQTKGCIILAAILALGFVLTLN